MRTAAIKKQYADIASYLDFAGCRLPGDDPEASPVPDSEEAAETAVEPTAETAATAVEEPAAEPVVEPTVEAAAENVERAADGEAFCPLFDLPNPRPEPIFDGKLERDFTPFSAALDAYTADQAAPREALRQYYQGQNSAFRTLGEPQLIASAYALEQASQARVGPDLEATMDLIEAMAEPSQ